MLRSFVLAAFTVGSLGPVSAMVASIASAAPPNAELPLKRVVLYSSGVGFFERSGDIEGKKQVELKFNIEDVNDVLKSMIVRDLGDGQISHATYDSPEPITHTLETFSIDLARNPTFSDLLKQIRGEKVLVMTPNPTTGVIVGVERRRQAVGKDQQVVDVDTLLLKTDTGLRAFPMANIIETKIVNEQLDKELQDALGILAQAHAKNKKTVTLNFQGKGKRPVSVGYIQEAPVWKATYRLALEEKDSHFLQGWAIVENTTEQDWQDVHVTFVSGQPVSFQMDLYQPMFADRPVIIPELFTNLQPRVHDQDLLPGRQPGEVGLIGGFGGGVGGNAAGSGGDPKARPFVTSVIPALDGGKETAKTGDQPLDLKKGVVNVAQADELGELFRYAISVPLSLGREKAALLPIVNDPVKGTKVSLFNAEVHPKHPMHAIKLVNNTKYRLMQGPITVFDAGEYAGDAQIQSIAPGSERLITYSVDLDVEIAVETAPYEEIIAEVYVSKGNLHSKRLVIRRQTFTIKNSSDKQKLVYVELPIDSKWQLREPKQATEKTRDLYRFAVDVPPYKSIEFRTTEGRDVGEQVSLRDPKPDSFRLWLDAPRSDPFSVTRPLVGAGPAVRAAIAELHKRQASLGEIVAKRKSLEGEMIEINTEQDRIRKNMGQLDRNSDLFHRYERLFGEQEDRLAKLRPELKAVAIEAANQEKVLDDYISDLDVKEKSPDKK